MELRQRRRESCSWKPLSYLENGPSLLMPLVTCRIERPVNSINNFIQVLNLNQAPDLFLCEVEIDRGPPEAMLAKRLSPFPL